MILKLTECWRALRDRMAARRAARAALRAEIAPKPRGIADLLEDALNRERAEVAKLGAEMERLRQDNRALLNSLLGTAGIPPLEVPRTGAEAPPIRHRSWSQIAATREIEAARHARKEQEEKH